MSRKLSLFPILTAILAVAWSSCTKESTKNSWASQETTIENFLTSMTGRDSSYYVVSNGGSERLVVSEGRGEELESSGTVSFYYAGYTLKGTSLSASNMFATNNRDIAEASSWDLTDSTAFNIETLNLSEAHLIDGLKKGLAGVKGGEECYILFSSKYGFGKKVFGNIPSNSALAYHVWVESVSNE